jgi:hypothetical protein
MDQGAIVRAAVAGGMIALVAFAGACGTTQEVVAMDEEDGRGPNYSSDGGIPGDGSDQGEPPVVMPEQFSVTLVPEGVAGMQRVNFALPLPAGALTDPDAIQIAAGSVELAVARRSLARYADGSLRSVQLQLDVDVSATPTLDVRVGVPGLTGPSLVEVATTLTGSGNNVRPKVWVRLPSSVLAASGVAGPVVPRAQLMGTPLDVWSSKCDYAQWDTNAFLATASTSREVWLFDRVTAMYRGYAITGELVPLRSAYREAEIYRAGMTITNGTTTGIAVPGASTDLKYHYAQGMAMHYLLTGDDRFREAAEAVSARVAGMWNPQYNGADGFWTERHAGFALLAHEWAALVSDDKVAAITARAELAATAYLKMQMQYPSGYTDQNARCFAHTATAHGESYGYTGCSPWMSAILVDALDAHARRVGGARAVDVRKAIARIGRIIARDGRDSTGKPYYWMGVGNTKDEVDAYNEHWGEAAYVVGMAWDATGRSEPALKQAADSLLAGFAQKGVAGHVRSFNWQCRSAVLAPAFLK